MRRVLLIGGPLLILLALAMLFSIRRADSRAPFDPLRKYVVHRETLYVERFNSTGTLETKLWVEGTELQQTMDRYMDWLGQKPGWIVVGGEKRKAMRGGTILPTESIVVDQAFVDRYHVTYRRELSGIDEWISKLLHPHDGVNDGPRENPVGW